MKAATLQAIKRPHSLSATATGGGGSFELLAGVAGAN